MASILYSVYAVVIMLIAAIGLLWIEFSVPGPGSDQRRERAYTVLGVVFIAVLIGLFLA